MNKYAVVLSNKQRHLMTDELLLDHVTYLKALKKKGVLPFCGPCVDGTAIMIVLSRTLEEAQGLVEEDPFSRANYYTDRKVVEVIEATEENNFLLN